MTNSMDFSRDPADRSPPHLSEWTLDQLVEGALTRAELSQAEAHLQACDACTGELETFRSLHQALSSLPRFEPTVAFADTVMARVRIAPRTAPELAWLQRWLPTTGSGWALLLAALVVPALPVVAAVAWVLTHPLVTLGGLAAWAGDSVRTGAGSAAGRAFDWFVASPLASWAQMGYAALSQVPLPTLAGALVVMALATTVSALSLVRLARTPLPNVHYAK